MTTNDLEKCYISLCLEIFKSAGFSPCDKKNQIDSDLIYRRDLVWMAINTITYMFEKGYADEATRILTRIGGCNGLCKGYYDPLPDHDCGCGGQNRKE